MNLFRSLSVLAVLCVFSFPCAATQASDLVEARALIQKGESARAYEMLAPFAFELAGQEEYDYLLGVAALESGHPTDATLAFERVLAVNPNHAGARLDMGRAYFALGNDTRARQEFEAVRQLNPPPAALATIDRYLAAIDERVEARLTRVTGYVEAAFGHDSNVNQATSQGSLYLPAFGGNFTLSSQSQQLGDDYNALATGAEVTHRIDDRNAFYGGADAQMKAYRQRNAYDVTSADLHAGWEHGEDDNAYRVGVAYNDYRLESERYRYTMSLSGDWRRKVDAFNLMNVFGRYSQIKYASDVNKSNNVHLLGTGLGWTRLLSEAQAAYFSGSVFGGYEWEEFHRDDGNKLFAGLRVGVQQSLAETLDGFIAGGLQYADYDRMNTLYLMKREECIYDVTAGLTWRFARDWRLKPQASWTRSDSNLSIYDYKRYDVSLTLRYEFR